MPSIAPASVDLVLCDLPYGTTQNKWDSVLPFERLWCEYDRIRRSNAAVVLTGAQPFSSKIVASNLCAFKYAWIWRKEAGTGFLNAKKQPLRDFEDILVFYRSQPTYNPQMRTGLKPYVCTAGHKNGRSGTNYGAVGERPTTVSEGDRYPLTTLEFKRDAKREHPTQKPVALMEYLIRTYTNPGDTVLDNCMGSGTTGVACMNTGRRFIGIEQDQSYFAVARRRITEAQANAAAV